MSELPRYPDTEGKDLSQRVNELENYIINLHRYIRFALETIDEKNMTKAYNQEFVGKVSFDDLATAGSTEINGANITAGTITLNSLQSDSGNDVLTMDSGGFEVVSEIHIVEDEPPLITTYKLVDGEIQGFDADGTINSRIGVNSVIGVIKADAMSMNIGCPTTIEGELTASGDITTGSIDADSIDTETLSADDIDGVTINGSVFTQSSQNSTKNYLDILKVQYGMLYWYRAPTSNPNNRTLVGKLGMVDGGSSYYIDFHTENNVPLRINGINFNADTIQKSSCWVTASNTATQSFSSGQVTTITWNQFVYENDPLDYFNLGTGGTGSTGIICKKAGTVEISALINMTSTSAAAANTYGHLILYINGTAINIYHRTLQPTATNTSYCAEFTPVYFSVSANDKINLRFYSPAGCTSSSGLENRTSVKYIS